VKLDGAGFEMEMARARKRSKASSKFSAESGLPQDNQIDASWATEFRGYPEQDFVILDGARVLGLFAFEENGLFELADSLVADQRGWVVTDCTVFYPEGGGQVADQGSWTWDGGAATVLDARRTPDGRAILHLLRIDTGTLRPGIAVSMEVDEWTRRKTQANHTGTHLLHAALRKVLGESARQMGSLVAPDRLRFDYAALRPTTAEEQRQIERLVNEEILRDVEVRKHPDTPMEKARKMGAIMFFGEKYGENVRVVDVPGFSTELCGGCHVGRTGEIGAFKIVSDRGLAAGVRRLEAVTSLNAVERMQRDEEILSELSQIANARPDELPEKLTEAFDALRGKEKEISHLKAQLAGAGAPSVDDGIVEISGIKVLARRVPSLPASELRNLADTFRGRLKSGIVLLGTEGEEGKVTLLAAVTADLVKRVSAHDLAQAMAPAVGGKGGGKPDLAQAGGRDPSKIGEALGRGVARIRERLSG